MSRKQKLIVLGLILITISIIPIACRIYQHQMFKHTCADREPSQSEIDYFNLEGYYWDRDVSVTNLSTFFNLSQGITDLDALNIRLVYDGKTHTLDNPMQQVNNLNNEMAYRLYKVPTADGVLNIIRPVHIWEKYNVKVSED